MKEIVDIAAVWESLRQALQQLRGRNRFRGNAEYLLHRNEVRLYKENRSGQLQSALIVIHLSPTHAGLWAERKPGGSVTKVADFGGDWKAWLEAIVDECRGADYLHTHADQADYRRATIATHKNSDEN